MTKYRRRKKRRQPAHKRQSVSTLKRKGQRAFDQAQYAKANETWERAAAKAIDNPLKAALAEAKFRLAMTHYEQDGDEVQLAQTLKRALEYTPDDPRLHFHLGLTHLRTGNSEQGIAPLQKAYVSPMAERAAFPLALALERSRQQAPFLDTLTPKQQQLLAQAVHFQQRPYEATDPAALRGFVAYDNQMWQTAQRELSDALAETTLGEQAILHKYLGNIAIHEEAWQVAVEHWQQALALGLDDPVLIHNLGEVCHRLAETALQAGELARATQLAGEALRLKPTDKQLNALQVQVMMRQGNQAAQRDQWEEAVRHWEAAQKVGGNSFRLAYNLALAYEKLDDYDLAAETWREVLRRRPRRQDHPDALNAEQVAQIWQRSAEAYIKTELYDEALKVYRTAIKYDEDNLPLRMAYAEAAMTEGRLQLAENELERILERNSDYVPALLLIGEVRVERYHSWWGNPTHSWQRVLEIDPDNGEARDLLADYHLNQVDDMRWWYYDVARAGEHLQKAAEYTPHRPDVLFQLGAHLLEAEADVESAATYFDRALQYAGRDIETNGKIIGLWLGIHEDERAEATLQQAKERISSIPTGFYVLVISMCYRLDREDVAPQWVERAQAVAAPDEPVLLMIGQTLGLAGHPEVAREYLERAIEADQMPEEAHFMLGFIAARQNDLQTAKRAWKRAERIARQKKDTKLLERIEQARMMFESPIGGILNQIMSGDLSGLSSSMLEGLLEPDDWLEDNDWVEDDDDGWW